MHVLLAQPELTYIYPCLLLLGIARELLSERCSAGTQMQELCNAFTQPHFRDGKTQLFTFILRKGEVFSYIIDSHHSPHGQKHRTAGMLGSPFSSMLSFMLILCCLMPPSLTLGTTRTPPHPPISTTV